MKYRLSEQVRSPYTLQVGGTVKIAIPGGRDVTLNIDQVMDPVSFKSGRFGQHKIVGNELLNVRLSKKYPIIVVNPPRSRGGGGTTPRRTPTTTPSATTGKELKDLIGKTFNLYAPDEFNEKSTDLKTKVGRFIIKRAEDHDDSYLIEFGRVSSDVNQNSNEKYKIAFECDKDHFSIVDASLQELVKLAMKANSINQSNLNPTTVFSLDLLEVIRKKICCQNQIGMWVRCADFSKAEDGIYSDEGLAEGKRVVRLSESDLVKLVKRVIKEQRR